MKKWEDFERLVGSVNTEEEFSELKATTELIGEIIKARLAKGWTQTELAKRTGLKQSAIARLESYSTVPKIDTLIKLTNSLGLKFSFIDKSTEINKENLIEVSNTETDSIKKELRELKSIVQSLNEKFDSVLNSNLNEGRITKTKVTIEEQTIEPHNINERLWWAETQTQTPSINKLLAVLSEPDSKIEGTINIKNPNRYSTSSKNKIIPFIGRSMKK